LNECEKVKVTKQVFVSFMVGKFRDVRPNENKVNHKCELIKGKVLAIRNRFEDFEKNITNMGKLMSGEKKVRVIKKKVYKNWGNTLIFMQNKMILLMHMITIYLWFYSYIRRHILILMILILVFLVFLKFFYKNFRTSFLEEFPSALPPIWRIEHQIDFVSEASFPN